MNFRIGIAFALFFVVAGICNPTHNASKSRPCAVEVDIITDEGDATSISASGGPGNIAGTWWDKEAGGGSNIIGVQAMKMNLGGHYREYTFTFNECLTATPIELTGAFAEGENICEPGGQGAVVWAYQNSTMLNVTEKDNGDGTCSYVVTR